MNKITKLSLDGISYEIGREGEYSKEEIDDKLSAKAEITTKTISYYVDVNTGSDDNDGSESAPFKTIQHAIDILPKILYYGVTITVADGFYDEDVSIKLFNGATLSLIVANIQTTEPSNQCQINTLTIASCNNAVVIRGFNIIGQRTVSLNGSKELSVLISDCNNISMAYCNIDGGAPYGIGVDRTRSFYIGVSYVSNTTSIAIYMNSNSYISTYQLHGSNNTGIGIQCRGGIVSISTLEYFSATTPIASSLGGLIIKGLNQFIE